MKRIGLLALQGDFAAHAAALSALGVEPVEVRRCVQLEGLHGLILPGGETTTLLNLMEDEPWFDAIRSFHAQGGHVLGTCAGAIMLARKVLNPPQPSLGLIDAVVERNGFGRQLDSFETMIRVDALDGEMHAVFIRAPRFVELGGGVEVLAALKGEPVLIRQGTVMAGSFHPELTADARLHRYFVECMERGRDAYREERSVAAS